MKTLALSLIAAVGLTANAYASDDLAKKNNCYACHKADAKLVGPSFKEIAAKYKADKKAEATLADKVKKGGSGVWGAVPMPPNAAVKDEDIKALVKWILATK